MGCSQMEDIIGETLGLIPTFSLFFWLVEMLRKIEGTNDKAYTKVLKYCGIIIVRGGSMFVDFMGHPYQWIYIPMNIFNFL